MLPKAARKPHSATRHKQHDATTNKHPYLYNHHRTPLQERSAGHIYPL